MFANKNIKVFSKDVFQLGAVVTLCYMDPADYGARMKEGKPFNALIIDVEDQKLILRLKNGQIIDVTMELLIDPDKPNENMYTPGVRQLKILGIATDAVSSLKQAETIKKISKVYECSDYDNKEKVDNIGHILGYDY